MDGLWACSPPYRAIRPSRHIYFTLFCNRTLVNGAVGGVVAPRGRLFRVLELEIARGKIVRIDVIGDPARLRELDLAILAD